jgi:hypothetical protein
MAERVDKRTFEEIAKSFLIGTKEFLPSECCTDVEDLRVRQVVKFLCHHWCSRFMKGGVWPHSCPGSAILLSETDPLYSKGIRCLVFDGTHRTIGAQEAVAECTKLGTQFDHIKVVMVTFEASMCHNVPTHALTSMHAL